MAAVAIPPSSTNDLLYSDQISPSGSPPGSPPFYSALSSSLDDSAHNLIHSDDLPPAFSEEGATPIPSEDHSDMVSHHSEIVVVDEESFHNIHHRPTSPTSRPVSPTPPRTTATPLVVHNYRSPLSNSFTASEAMLPSPDEDASTRSVAGIRSVAAANSTMTSFFTAPPPPPTRQDHHSIPSPFSFFAHSPHSYSDQHGASPPVHIKTLRIELAQKEVVISTGKTALLEGTLYLTLQKTTKIKTLNLDFSGHTSVTWVDDNAYSPATRFISAPHIEHTWALIAHQHKQPATILPAGQHAFPFSLELSDNLPETMTTTHGKVAYKLSANLTKPGISFSTTTASAPVTILRRHIAEGPLARAYQRGGRLANEIGDKVKYKIVMPQIRLPHSMKVPLQVMITSPNPDISIQVLQVGLWERVLYRAEDRKRADMRLVKIQKSGGWPHVNVEGNPTTEPVTWNKVLLFEMPEMGPESHECNPSGDNGLMKVTHHMRFTILGCEGAKRFRLENEMEVKVLAFEDESPAPPMLGEDENGMPLNELPSYLTSFSTPRVSFDAERDGNGIVIPGEDDDVLRALVAQIHLPTYAESEEELASPSVIPSSHSQSKTAHSIEPSLASSALSTVSSEASSIRSKSSIGRQNSLRLTTPMLSLSLLAPCKTTVTSVAHESSTLNDMEPDSKQTINGIGLQSAKSALEIPTLDLRKFSPLQSPLPQEEVKDGLKQALADSGAPVIAERPSRILQAEKFIERQSAPEIMSLANLIMGSIVVGSGSSLPNDGKLLK
ncbi:hypothetical protein FBU30_003147 [Linnemannia zychae]|nr:hypothetical protein FBU30_003147 [Linnemannia zychae]